MTATGEVAFSDRNQIPLFEEVTLNSPVSRPVLSFEERVGMALEGIDAVMDKGKIPVSAFSAGKDSSCVMALILMAAKRRKENGLPVPPIVVCHADTLIENPAIAAHARSEIAKIQAYAQRYDLEVIVDIATPSLSEHYLVQVLSGRTIANMPDGGKRCSDMLKVAPITRQKRRIAKAMGAEDTVTCIGTRLEESAERSRSMVERGESDSKPVRNRQGDWILSPIMHWSIDDVFEFLAYAKTGVIEAYSDFSETLELYRSMNSGACELSVYQSGRAPSTACSARSGCWACLRRNVVDGPAEESLNNMVAEPQYAYMQGLAKLRDYIAKTHYDPAKRNWLGRTVNDDGTITIAPSGYSPEHCTDLIRFALTIDAAEKEASSALGISPRFEILRPTDVVAIDFIAARYGYQIGLNASFWYREIHERGRRFTVPKDVAFYPKKAFPAPLNVPFSDSQYEGVFSGQRDLAAATADCEQTITKRSGAVYSGGLGANQFHVDEEGAELFLAFDLDRALERYHRSDANPTEVVHYFLRLGTVQLFKGQHAENDRQLRMANRVYRGNLRPVLNNPEALVARLGNRTEFRPSAAI